MLTGRRVLFCLDKTRGKLPVGGRNVAFDLINELRRMEVAAYPVYPQTSNTHYPFKKIDAEPLIFPTLVKTRIEWAKRFGTMCRFYLQMPFLVPGPAIKRASDRFELIYKLLHGRIAVLFSGCKLLDLQPTDIVIIRCDRYNRFSDLFPDNLKILFVQDTDNLLRAYAEGGRPSRADFPFAFATSEISKAALESIYDGEVAHIPLVVGSGEAEEFPSHKKKQIAFFPRKRDYELSILTKAIQDFLPDWRVARIVNVSDAERDAILRESAIFLSFSHREGFGLPPAEAMRFGALVIGYTGVGGNEYMTDETCVLIEDSNMVAFIAELRKAASNFREDGAFSGNYEKIRRNGFDAVNLKYSYEAFRKPFRAFWNKVDRSLR